MCVMELKYMMLLSWPQCPFLPLAAVNKKIFSLEMFVYIRNVCVKVGKSDAAHALRRRNARILKHLVHNHPGVAPQHPSSLRLLAPCPIRTRSVVSQASLLLVLGLLKINATGRIFWPYLWSKYLPFAGAVTAI